MRVRPLCEQSRATDMPRSERGVNHVEKQQRAGSVLKEKQGETHQICLFRNMSDVFKDSGASLLLMLVLACEELAVVCVTLMSHGYG